MLQVQDAVLNIQKRRDELKIESRNLENEVGDYHDRLKRGLVEKRNELLDQINDKFSHALNVLNSQEEYLKSLLRDLEDEKITEIPLLLHTEPTVSSENCGKFRIGWKSHPNCPLQLPKIFPFKAVVAAEKTRFNPASMSGVVGFTLDDAAGNRCVVEQPFVVRSGSKTIVIDNASVEDFYFLMVFYRILSGEEIDEFQPEIQYGDRVLVTDSISLFSERKEEETEEGKLVLSRKLDFYISQICAYESDFFLTLPHCVKVYDFKGNLRKEWGEHGKLEGQFRDPWGIAVNDGQIYVCDYQNGRIQVFDLYGNLLNSFHCKLPSQVHIVQDLVFVGSEKQYIRVFTKRGDLLHQFKCNRLQECAWDQFSMYGKYLFAVVKETACFMDLEGRIVDDFLSSVLACLAYGDFLFVIHSDGYLRAYDDCKNILLCLKFPLNGGNTASLSMSIANGKLFATQTLSNRTGYVFSFDTGIDAKSSKPYLFKLLKEKISGRSGDLMNICRTVFPMCYQHYLIGETSSSFLTVSSLSDELKENGDVELFFSRGELRIEPRNVLGFSVKVQDISTAVQNKFIEASKRSQSCQATCSLVMKDERTFLRHICGSLSQAFTVSVLYDEVELNNSPLIFQRQYLW
jgi:WD40 repeat protein